MVELGKNQTKRLTWNENKLCYTGTLPYPMGICTRSILIVELFTQAFLIPANIRCQFC